MEIISHNVRGYSGKQSCKKDHIAAWIKSRKASTIYLTQETWESNDENTEVEGIIFTSNEKKRECGDIQTKGGVGIVLSESAQSDNQTRSNRQR